MGKYHERFLCLSQLNSSTIARVFVCVCYLSILLVTVNGEEIISTGKNMFA